MSRGGPIGLGQGVVGREGAGGAPPELRGGDGEELAALGRDEVPRPHVDDLDDGARDGEPREGQGRAHRDRRVGAHHEAAPPPRGPQRRAVVAAGPGGGQRRDQPRAEVQRDVAVHRQGHVALPALRHKVPLGAELAGLAREEPAPRVAEAAAAARKLVARGLAAGADAAAVAVRAPEALGAHVAARAGPVAREVLLALALPRGVALGLGHAARGPAQGDAAEGGAVGAVVVRVARASAGGRRAPVARAVAAAHVPSAGDPRARPVAAEAGVPEGAVAEPPHDGPVPAPVVAPGPVVRGLARVAERPAPEPGGVPAVARAHDRAAVHAARPVPRARRRGPARARGLAREPRPPEVAGAAAGAPAVGSRAAGAVACAGVCRAPKTQHIARAPRPPATAHAVAEGRAMAMVAARRPHAPGALPAAAWAPPAPVAGARPGALAAVVAAAVPRADHRVGAVGLVAGGAGAQRRAVRPPQPRAPAQRLRAVGPVLVAPGPAPELLPGAAAGPAHALPVAAAGHARVPRADGAWGGAQARGVLARRGGGVQRMAPAAVGPAKAAPRARPRRRRVRGVARARAGQRVAHAVAAAHVVGAAGAQEGAGGAGPPVGARAFPGPEDTVGAAPVPGTRGGVPRGARRGARGAPEPRRTLPAGGARPVPAARVLRALAAPGAVRAVAAAAHGVAQLLPRRRARRLARDARVRRVARAAPVPVPAVVAAPAAVAGDAGPLQPRTDGPALRTPMPREAVVARAVPEPDRRAAVAVAAAAAVAAGVARAVAMADEALEVAVRRRRRRVRAKGVVEVVPEERLDVEARARVAAGHPPEPALALRTVPGDEEPNRGAVRAPARPVARQPVEAPPLARARAAAAGAGRAAVGPPVPLRAVRAPRARPVAGRGAVARAVGRLPHAPPVPGAVPPLRVLGALQRAGGPHPLRRAPLAGRARPVAPLRVARAVARRVLGAAPVPGARRQPRPHRDHAGTAGVAGQRAGARVVARPPGVAGAVRGRGAPAMPRTLPRGREESGADVPAVQAPPSTVASAHRAHDHPVLALAPRVAASRRWIKGGGGASLRAVHVVVRGRAGARPGSVDPGTAQAVPGAHAREPGHGHGRGRAAQAAVLPPVPGQAVRTLPGGVPIPGRQVRVARAAPIPLHAVAAPPVPMALVCGAPGAL